VARRRGAGRKNEAIGGGLMRKSRENHGTIMGKSWINLGKFEGKPIGKTIGKCIFESLSSMFAGEIVGPGDFPASHTLVNIHSLLLKMAIEIVDFPIPNGEFFVCLPESNMNQET